MNDTDSRRADEYWSGGEMDGLLYQRNCIEDLNTRIDTLVLKICEQNSEIELLKANNAELKAFLASAGDALEHESWVSEEQCGLPSQFQDLIQKLREAVE